jgi:predicted RNA-binding Zn-ribbon protein involved in translation (DUF1610 family)
VRESEDRTYLQCTNCGEIYRVDDYISAEKVYINSYCPYCGHERALNVGNSLDDIYIYYDVTLKKDYFIY